MAKNSLAKRINQAAHQRVVDTRQTHTQMCLDAAMIAANDVFNMGESRCMAFAQAFTENLMKIATTALEDTGDLEYTKAKVDGRLQQICGKHFSPWAERYGE